MRAVVDAAQPPSVDVRVDLCGRERAVAEELLDRAQIGAALEEMSRECVPQAMRMREHAANRRGIQAPTARREEQRVLGPARELRTGFEQVARE